MHVCQAHTQIDSNNNNNNTNRTILIIITRIITFFKLLLTIVVMIVIALILRKVALLLTCHFWANYNKRPEILSGLDLKRTNLGTFVLILRKVAFSFYHVKCSEWRHLDVTIGFSAEFHTICSFLAQTDRIPPSFGNLEFSILLTIDYWLLTIDYWLLTADYWLLTIDY